MRIGAADPELVAAWTAAWAAARELAPPRPAHGGICVDVGWPEQRARYVFASIDSQTLRDLARSITDPYVYLKVCAPADAVMRHLPSPWAQQEDRSMMRVNLSEIEPTPSLHAPYKRAINQHNGVLTVTITDNHGERAASGKLVQRDDLAVFDRIRTEEAYRRQGLARAVMNELSVAARLRGAREGVLVATDMGRKLYETLGWRFYAPYTSAVIPGGASGK